MPDPVIADLVPPDAAIVRVQADPAAASQITPRDAELCDMLALASLEPRLAVAAPTLNLLAVTRPNRPSIGG